MQVRKVRTIMKYQPAMILLVTAILVLCSAARQTPAAGNPINWKKVHILVYTKNGKGYVHDNIAAASASLQQLGQRNGFAVDVSANSADFSDDNLKKYNVLVFNNTNNDVFDN